MEDSTNSKRLELLVIDVGNTRTKMAIFVKEFDLNTGIKQLLLTETHVSRNSSQAGWKSFTEKHLELEEPFLILISGSHPQWQERVRDELRASADKVSVRIVTRDDLQLPIKVRFPEKVGMDRLLNAKFASGNKHSDAPAIVIDTGTATTVDAISIEGEFLGGTIQPGLELSAKALHEYTAVLPLVDFAGDRFEEPEVIGKDTTAAIQSGLFWGHVGAIREIVSQMETEWHMAPDLFLTGGSAKFLEGALAKVLDKQIRLVEQMPLISLAEIGFERRQEWL